MGWRRWLPLTALGVVAVLVGARLALPEIVRHVAIARLTAIAHRPVSLQAVEVDLLRGRLVLRGLRVAERGDPATFAELERLDARLHVPSLLRGHVWIRDLVLRRPTVHVVRLTGGEFNLSDLVRRSGGAGPLDVTVDRFALIDGTVTLEDRALPETRTWVSEHIAIRATNLSTRRGDGRAEGTSVTGGAPLSVRIDQLRLYPIHLRGTVTVEGLDLGLARVYVPGGSPVVPDRGRLTTSVQVTLDAHEGLRLDGTGRLEDVALVRPDGAPAALVRRVEAQLRALTFAPGGVGLGHLEATGSALLSDPAAPTASRFLPAAVRAVVDDLVWSPGGPSGRVALDASVRGRGTLRLTGAVRAPPAPSDLRLRATGFDLGPWAALVVSAPRLSGVARGDLRMSEPLRAGVPARVRGAVGVDRLRVADGVRTLLDARRVEARDLELEWPARIAIRRMVVEQPRARVDRDRRGTLPAAALWSAPGPRSRGSTRSSAGPPAATARAMPPFSVRLDVVEVADGTIEWRDEVVRPLGHLAVSQLRATVTGLGWPLRGPVGIRGAFRPPGGGQVRVAGRLALDPVSIDARVSAREADLAPYQPYLPTAVRVTGWAGGDVRLVLSGTGAITVRGSATLSRLDLRDGRRTVARIERAVATDLETEWPRHVSVGRLMLRAPWLLIERDETGAFPLPALLWASTAAAGPAPGPERPPGGPAVRVDRLVVEDGGIRVVDRSLSPAFAADLEGVRLGVEGLSTTPPATARVELHGQLARGATLAVHGTIGPVRGPLRADLQGELRGFLVPRTDSYLVRYIGWSARRGTLTTAFRGQVQGNALRAQTDIRLSRLQVVRAGPRDAAQSRVGLPLGLIVALMKDARGDIHVSLPIGGRLNDPRFDLRDAIWRAVRTVAVHAITLPVSWIGRLHVGTDARIEDVEVRPVRFEPGTSTPTAEGRAQAARLAAFLEHVPGVRLALTPLVSSRDQAALRRRAVDARIERLAHDAGIPPETAVARLYAGRFHAGRPPDDPGASRAALIGAEPASPTEASTLAATRLQALRTLLAQAGIAPVRLPDGPAAGPAEDGDEAVALQILEPEAPARTPVADAVRRLGAAITGTEPADE